MRDTVNASVEVFLGNKLISSPIGKLNDKEGVYVYVSRVFSICIHLDYYDLLRDLRDYNVLMKYLLESTSFIHLFAIKWVECSPLVWETWVQSQVASYQRH